MRQRSTTTTGGGSHMWPPPAPPKGVDYTALPLGLRPSKLPCVSREGAPSHQTADGGHVSRGSVQHGAVETSHVAAIATNTQDNERKSLDSGHVSLHASHNSHMTIETVERTIITPDGSTTPARILNHEAPSDPSAAPIQMLAMVTAGVNSETNATPLRKRRRSESMDAYHRKAFMGKCCVDLVLIFFSLFCIRSKVSFSKFFTVYFFLQHVFFFYKISPLSFLSSYISVFTRVRVLITTSDSVFLSKCPSLASLIVSCFLHLPLLLFLLH